MDIQKVVKNLFDRANSTHSQNEAEQCILKAHELMAKYGIGAKILSGLAIGSFGIPT